VRRIEFKWNDRPQFAEIANKISIGSMVRANFLGRGEFLPGVISNIRKDGTYDVTYDDFEKETETHLPVEMLKAVGVDVIMHEKTAFSEAVTTLKNIKMLQKDWEKIPPKKKGRKATYHFKLCAKLDDGSVVRLCIIQQPKYIPMNIHTALNELMAHVPVTDIYRKDFPCFADFARHTPPREEIIEDVWWQRIVRYVEEFVSAELDAEAESRAFKPTETDLKFLQLEVATYEGMR
jgi:hypothetical protein